VRNDGNFTILSTDCKPVKYVTLMLMEKGPSPASAEKEKRIEFKLLTAENYLDMITKRQQVVATDTIARGDSEGMRAKYVQNTERLIDRIRHGFADESGPGHDSADVVFYLDKSARPVYWLTDAMWEVFPEEGAKKPDTHFLNLHANEGPGGGRPTREQMIRQVQEGIFDSYIETMKQVYPDMAGKNLLVVDEVSVSGSTEELAYQIFRRAFPDAHIKSAAWMQAGRREDRYGNSYPSEIPVWYKKSSDSGRGVSGINPEKSSLSGSAAQRAGAEILSTRPDTPDLESLQLRKEIRQMAQDVLSGEQSIIPEHDPDSARYGSMRIRSVGGAKPEGLPLFSK
jgi:hypothetical protein